MGMDFSKLSKAIDEALAPEVTEAPAAEEKKMTAEDFEAYAREQIELAKAESDEGARARLLALKEQVDVVAKFEFKDSELPSVRFYKAPEQKRPTVGAEGSVQSSQPGGPYSWTAKAQGSAKELAELIAKFLGTGEATPAKPGQVEPNTTAPADEPKGFVWPQDLTLDD